MLGWLRRRQVRAIPDALWSMVVQRYEFLPPPNTQAHVRLRERVSEFLIQKEFTGAHGFVITDEVALSIAVQAVLPVLHLGLRWYDDFVGIVVHPEEVIARRIVADDVGLVHHYDEVLTGEAMDGGPVMLSWRDVSNADQSAQVGYNVVIHEFIHKIDMRDGLPDGCPPLPSERRRQQWQATIQQEFEAFCDKVTIAERFGGVQPWLDTYGAQSVDEFFAVACEGYFVNRRKFSEEFPPLMALFDGFFGFGESTAS